MAPGGDIDNDGQIDSGDTVVFSYAITNLSGNEISIASLKTN